MDCFLKCVCKNAAEMWMENLNSPTEIFRFLFEMFMAFALKLKVSLYQNSMIRSFHFSGVVLEVCI